MSVEEEEQMQQQQPLGVSTHSQNHRHDGVYK